MSISTQQRASFPWPSALALLYPLGAALFIGTKTSARWAVIVGCGIANLAYVLFAAGIFKGTFRVLGLGKRWQVFGSAVLSFVLGTVLTNVGAQ